MTDAPTNATVRTLLRVLEGKGHIRRSKDGKAHLYEAAGKPAGAAKSALRRLVDVFFGGSLEKAVSGIIDLSEESLSKQELERLEALIATAKKKSCHD